MSFKLLVISSLYVCIVKTIYLFSFVETSRKFIIAKLSIRKLGSASVLMPCLFLKTNTLCHKRLINLTSCSWLVEEITDPPLSMKFMGMGEVVNSVCNLCYEMYEF